MIVGMKGNRCYSSPFREHPWNLRAFRVLSPVFVTFPSPSCSRSKLQVRGFDGQGQEILGFASAFGLVRGSGDLIGLDFRAGT